MILYQYDLAGHLISELHYDGTRVRDYVWLDDTLVAQIEAVGSVHYLHTDHLGTPRAATNANGTVVWRWESEAFGGTPAQFVEGLINTIGGLCILNTALKYDVDTIPEPPSSEAAGR